MKNTCSFGSCAEVLSQLVSPKPTDYWLDLFLSPLYAIYLFLFYNVIQLNETKYIVQLEKENYILNNILSWPELNL